MVAQFRFHDELHGLPQQLQGIGSGLCHARPALVPGSLSQPAHRHHSAVSPRGNRTHPQGRGRPVAQPDPGRDPRRPGAIDPPVHPASGEPDHGHRPAVVPDRRLERLRRHVLRVRRHPVPGGILEFAGAAIRRRRSLRALQKGQVHGGDDVRLVYHDAGGERWRNHRNGPDASSDGIAARDRRARGSVIVQRTAMSAPGAGASCMPAFRN
mmetsp:Transcript_24848/g.58305  ORF Transcript_24848/g.58305 Transcript_24848/m.58305 type:complete len:211 (-) Transcript_24848:222-854(-)